MEWVLGFSPLHFSFKMSASPATILLAEDETNDVFLMRRAFEKAKLLHPLPVVSDGAEAISYLSGEGRYANRQEFPLPTLLLLDLKLPRRSGLEVLEWIRRQPSPLRRLPVVILSSSQQTIDINRAYELGANSYLVKPVDFAGLLELVKALEMYWFVFSQKPEVGGGSSLQFNQT